MAAPGRRDFEQVLPPVSLFHDMMLNQPAITCSSVNEGCDNTTMAFRAGYGRREEWYNEVLVDRDEKGFFERRMRWS
jgi:hypothetical protein